MRKAGLAEIVPPGLVLDEDWNLQLPEQMFPEESIALGAATDQRKLEFAAGRACAHRALGRLGFARTPILRGKSREPLWPAAVVGSITHCAGYAAAVVSWQTNIISVGIDAEPRRKLPPGVLQMVATAKEIDWYSPGISETPWELILFSAKESVFKTWFPIARTWLGFDEAEVFFNTESDRFRATLRPALQPVNEMPLRISGRYEVGETHVFTCAWIDR